MTDFPSFAPRIYHDARYIYLEFPPKDGNPATCVRFEKSDDGLNKALKLIPNITLDPGYVSGGANIADKLLTKGKIARISQETTRKRQSLNLPQSLKDKAAEIARKVRMK